MSHSHYHRSLENKGKYNFVSLRAASLTMRIKLFLKSIETNF